MAASLEPAEASVRNVVLVGAGHAHVEVLRSFGLQPPPHTRLILITRTQKTPYSGMLPGLIAGHYQPDDMLIDIGPLTRGPGTEVILAEAVGLDLDRRSVVCRDGLAVPYDIVSFDIGSTPNTRAIPGAFAHAIPVKPIDGFVGRFEDAVRRIRDRDEGAHIVVVGAGAAGVELILAIRHCLLGQLARSQLEHLRFSLITASSEILPAFPDRFRSRLRRILQIRGIRILENARVLEVSAGEIGIEGAPPVTADEIFWTTEATAPDWLRETGLSLDASGFIKIDSQLRAHGQQNVFAAGDVASFLPRNLPKSGVYAVRQGPVLDRNIRRLLAGEPLTDFHPQNEALYLLATGERHAVGTRNGFVFEGDWVWRFKNWLDRRFMGKYKSAAGGDSPPFPAMQGNSRADQDSL